MKHEKAMLFFIWILLCTGCGSKEEQWISAEENAEVVEQKEELTQIPLQEIPEEEIPEEEKSRTENIFVDVCGAVNNPGVYELLPDSRVYEAIACAGGFTEEASYESINQAQLLEDGMQIVVPTREEVQAGWITPQAGEKKTGMAEEIHTEKVNINTADESRLQTLDGIGKTRARAIIEYRQASGGFQTIEDIMNVEGIKEGTFEKIKDQIVVG